MNILMVTNTYTPIVGGVERSIRSFTNEYRKRGHNVLIITLEFDNMPEDEQGVIRLPAIRRFNGSDFSIRMPIPFDLDKRLKSFRPDIVHAHHPFILGDTALRISNKYQIPLVFTHHTRYEDYTHYVPIELPALKKFVIEITSGYAELADFVFAPSTSIKEYLLKEKVKTPTEVIPTGVDFKKYSQGNGNPIRERYGIENKRIIGHVGRLAKEKNLTFLTSCVIEYLKEDKEAVFFLAGKGPSYNEIRSSFVKAGFEDQFVYAGVLESDDLVNAYHAIDLFVFASKTETQGMVILEAMAAGTLVVALKASGITDVVVHYKTGFLVQEESRRLFVSTMNEAINLDDKKRKQFEKNAVRKAKSLSIEATAKKALHIYEQLLRQKFVYTDIENSPWSKAIGSIRAEWELVGNLASAVGDTITRELREHTSWVDRLFGWFKRNEWSVRLLNLDRSAGTEREHGLVMIQIDGLSMDVLKRAMQNGRLPFLQKLIRKEKYVLGDLYSGLPSATPAVQAELFYGVKGAVPSFSFLDKEEKIICRMYEIEGAKLVEERLARQGIGLLEGGSSYANVFSGGAKESQFCAVDLGWDVLWKRIRPIKLFILTGINLLFVLKTIFFMCVEFVLSVLSFMNGVLILRQHWFKELKFILTRLSICILLRDLVSFGARIDIVRGLPIIHVNFVGYDEHAHRRGPFSRFAFWTLKGIDKCVERIYKEAMHSKRRMYDVWLYADHGQAHMDSYAQIHADTVQNAVRRVYKSFKKVSAAERSTDSYGIQLLRSRYFGHPLLKKLAPVVERIKPLMEKDSIVVTAMGPIGHVYTFDSLSTDEKEEFAKKLVTDAHIPLVLVPIGHAKVKAFHQEGICTLPDDERTFWGTQHMFSKMATEDLIRIVHHKDAGIMSICGFRKNQVPMSFPLEEGAHGGLSFNEMHAFSLLPLDIARTVEHKDFLRPIDIRQAALKFLKRDYRDRVQTYTHPRIISRKKEQTVRIMTYNVHGCRGTDGKVFPERIARVIARANPDIVALQEVDMNRERSGSIDQPHLIARILEMKYHFAPTISVEEEHYGNAVLSRYPTHIIKAQTLPTHPQMQRFEQRGALWVQCIVGEKKLHCINTHLGLKKKERLFHIETLLGQEWLGAIGPDEAVIFIGDFNALPSSHVIKKVEKRYNDVQIAMHNYDAQATWFSHFPVGRIDHIFVNKNITISHVAVPKTRLERIASDHLPLIADVRIA